MEIQAIDIERRGGSAQCGTLVYRRDGRKGSLLWMCQWRRAQKVTVEFVPAEGALQEDVRKFHDTLVDAVVKAVFERTSRKTLFS